MRVECNLSNHPAGGRGQWADRQWARGGLLPRFRPFRDRYLHAAREDRPAQYPAHLRRAAAPAGKRCTHIRKAGHFRHGAVQALQRLPGFPGQGDALQQATLIEAPPPEY